MRSYDGTPLAMRVILLLVCWCQSVARLAGETEAWHKATQHLFNEAYAMVADLTNLSREDRLARAVLLFNVQPVSRANLDQAEDELKALMADNPADDAGSGAQFFLGRLAQVHRQPADLAAARRYYTALIDRHPHHPFAEQAQVKLALMDLYPVEARVPGADLLDALSARARLMLDPAARRDLSIALARACLFYRNDYTKQGLDVRPRALEYFREAQATGTVSFRTRAEVLVAIGELARELGRLPEARAAYAAFVTEFSRDIRAGTIRQRLAQLPEDPRR